MKTRSSDSQATHILWAFTLSPKWCRNVFFKGSQLLNFRDPFHPEKKTPLRCIFFFSFQSWVPGRARAVPSFIYRYFFLWGQFFVLFLYLLFITTSMLCSCQMTAPLGSPVVALHHVYLSSYSKSSTNKARYKYRCFCCIVTNGSWRKLTFNISCTGDNKVYGENGSGAGASKAMTHDNKCPIPNNSDINTIPAQLRVLRNPGDALRNSFFLCILAFYSLLRDASPR